MAGIGQSSAPNLAWLKFPVVSYQCVFFFVGIRFGRCSNNLNNKVGPSGNLVASWELRCPHQPALLSRWVSFSHVIYIIPCKYRITVALSSYRNSESLKKPTKRDWCHRPPVIAQCMNPPGFHPPKVQMGSPPQVVLWPPLTTLYFIHVHLVQSNPLLDFRKAKRCMSSHELKTVTKFLWQNGHCSWLSSTRSPTGCCFAHHDAPPSLFITTCCALCSKESDHPDTHNGPLTKSCFYHTEPKIPWVHWSKVKTHPCVLKHSPMENASTSQSRQLAQNGIGTTSSILCSERLDIPTACCRRRCVGFIMKVWRRTKL